MTPPNHLHDALAREREADIRRHAARPRRPRAPRTPFSAEAAAGASLVLAVAGLIALGAPLGA